MRLKTMLQLAALLAPIGLLSACGPAYNDSGLTGDMGKNATTYAYNNTNQAWDNIPNTGTGSGAGTPSANPTATPAPTPAPTGTTAGTNGSVSASSKVNLYCVIYQCTPTPIINIQLVTTWNAHIPVPIPDPAPVAGSPIIYNRVAYEVVGVASKSRQPTLLIRPIANLEAKR